MSGTIKNTAIRWVLMGMSRIELRCMTVTTMSFDAEDGDRIELVR